MFDMLPFPGIKGKTTDEKFSELLNYLIQFKETLEFALTNISTDNLSPELINKLNELGADIEKNKTYREEEVAQISNSNSLSLTVSDVMNSALFKSAIVSEMRKSLTIEVNYETGHLEYNVSNEGG